MASVSPEPATVNPEGQLRIRLDWDGRVIRTVTVEPRRLADISRLTCGKTPAQAALLIPLLFSLCGKAQGSAARLALDAAQGKVGISPAEERQVLAEALQESAWRLLIDLPQRFGIPANLPALAELRRQCGAAEPAAASADALEALLERHLLGMPCREWRESLNREAWLSRASTPLAGVLRRLEDEGGWGKSEICGLPEFSAPQIVESLLPALRDDPEFARCPEWRGEPAETGPLARSGGSSNSIVERLWARLAELPRLADALRRSDTLSSGWLRQVQVGENAGLAWLQTARGVLIHYARLASDGTVADYRIVAPTEWNFHPRGAYVRGLVGRPAGSPEQARASAELLLLALDPCVGYEMEIEHA